MPNPVYPHTRAHCLTYTHIGFVKGYFIGHISKFNLNGFTYLILIILINKKANSLFDINPNR